MRGLSAILGVVLLLLASTATAEDSLTVPVYDNSATRLLLPVINNTIPLNSHITVSSSSGPLRADIYQRSLWPRNGRSAYVRLLVIDVETVSGLSEITLHWKAADDELRPFWGGLGKVTMVNPGRTWLQQVIMMHPFSVAAESWYTDAQRLHANYIANDALMASQKYPLSRASHWLYDKPQSFFQLYLMTGDEWALRQARRFADYYLAQVNDKGYFALSKRQDIKYIMSRGLTYYYLLTGSEQVYDAIARQFKASLDWDPEYDGWRGFWTERNQAAALNTAIAYWEVSGSKEAKARIDAIVAATYAMTFDPVEDWPVRNCPQHTMQSHEGEGGDRAVCSPWMMALLADGLWRLVLLTDDTQAAELLRAFGQFFAEYGAYTVNHRGDTITAPYYLRAFPDTKLVEKNFWTDLQHTCEVAGMLGKSLLMYTGKKTAPVTIRQRFEQFASMCQDSLSGVVKKNMNKGKDAGARLKPPRRFGWMYSSTSELPWMMQTILSDME